MKIKTQKSAVKVSKGATKAMGKKNTTAFKSVSQFLMKTLTANPKANLETLIIMVRKINPKSKFATNELSAKQQLAWYRSAIKSNRIKGALSAKAKSKA